MDKLRLRFEKTGRAVYISHLDLMHTMQRVFSRAGFELKYSEGFNPHLSTAAEKVQYPSSLKIKLKDIEDGLFNMVRCRADSLSVGALQLSSADDAADDSHPSVSSS